MNIKSTKQSPPEPEILRRQILWTQRQASILSCAITRLRHHLNRMIDKYESLNQENVKLQISLFEQLDKIHRLPEHRHKSEPIPYERRRELTTNQILTTLKTLDQETREVLIFELLEKSSTTPLTKKEGDSNG